MNTQNNIYKHKNEFIFKINHYTSNVILRILYIFFDLICCYFYHINHTLFTCFLIYLTFIILIISEDVITINKNNFTYQRKRLFPFLNYKKSFQYKNLNFVCIGNKPEFFLSLSIIYFIINFVSMPSKGTSRGVWNYTYKRFKVNIKDNSEITFLINIDEQSKEMINLINKNIENANNILT